MSLWNVMTRNILETTRNKTNIIVASKQMTNNSLNCVAKPISVGISPVNLLSLRVNESAEQNDKENIRIYSKQWKHNSIT
jgi:hypothetical protein